MTISLSAWLMVHGVRGSSCRQGRAAPDLPVGDGRKVPGLLVPLNSTSDRRPVRTGGAPTVA